MPRRLTVYFFVKYWQKWVMVAVVGAGTKNSSMVTIKMRRPLGFFVKRLGSAVERLKPYFRRYSVSFET